MYTPTTEEPLSPFIISYTTSTFDMFTCRMDFVEQIQIFTRKALARALGAARYR